MIREQKWITEGDETGKPEYTSAAMPWSGFAALRTGWGQDDTWALMDAAPFGRAHQHEDKLSVLLYTNGKFLLTEGGNYAYDESEMRNYVLSTRSHNYCTRRWTGSEPQKDLCMEGRGY